MGPRRFRRGNAGAVDGAAPIAFGFNGAATFPPRKFRHTMKGRTITIMLQWGRDVSAAEIYARQSGAVDLVLASMGPRRFRRGNDEFFMTSANEYLASMGPRRFRRGNRSRRGGRTSPQQSFNGAATFPPSLRRFAGKSVTAASHFEVDHLMRLCVLQQPWAA